MTCFGSTFSVKMSGLAVGMDSCITCKRVQTSAAVVLDHFLIPFKRFIEIRLSNQFMTNLIRDGDFILRQGCEMILVNSAWFG